MNSNEEAIFHSFAYSIFEEVQKYIAENKEEFEKWQKEQEARTEPIHDVSGNEILGGK